MSEQIDTEQSFDQKQAEWKRLSEIGWMYMGVDDLKATQQALREFLVRDAQWVEKWKAALDLLDAPTARAAECERELERAREVLRGIQQMADEDIRTGRVPNGSILWQIEADARAALAPAPSGKVSDATPSKEN